jgi:hypothetical protein
MSTASRQASAFWTSFIRAVEAEPHEINSVQGASGIQHPVVAIGVDAGRRRLVLVSLETDARAAALMQADLQSAFRAIQIVVARPDFLNLGEFARMMLTEADTGVTTKELLSSYASWMRGQPGILAIPDDLLREWARANLSHLSWKLSKLTLKSTEGAPHSPSFAPEELIGEEVEDGPRRLLESVAQTDQMEQDRRMGLCPVPLYEFSSSEFELLQSGTDVEAVREMLRRLDLLQYFLPAPDHLALGLIDLGKISTVPNLIDNLVKTPDFGHPFGPHELIPAQTGFRDMILELRNRGFVAGGELNLEITDQGRQARSLVQARPREGLLFKILNRVSASLSFKSSWLPILRAQR